MPAHEAIAYSNLSRLNASGQDADVVAASNIFTMDAGNKNTARFSIETTDATAKSIVLSNPATDCDIVVKLKYTNLATITYPAGVVWKDGVAPSYNQGKIYYLYFITDNGGTAWLGSWTGAW